MAKALRHRIVSGIPLNGFEPPASGLSQSGTNWHMIALEGSWDGHWMGPFSLRKGQFDECVQRKRAMSVDIPVDYEHASFWGAMTGSKAPASGWIKALETREGTGGEAQLWAQVEWTATARQHIEAGEYRYLSPVIVFQTRDRKSGRMGGASIHSLALTNTPFLEELPEVRLNSALGALPHFDDEENEAMNEEQLRALAKALGLADGAGADEIIAAANRSAAQVQLAAGMVEAIGLTADTPREKAIARCLELRNPANDPAEVAALRARVVELEGDRTRREAEGLVAQALSERKLTGKDTPQYVWASKFALSNPEAFREWMANAPEVVPAAISRDPKVAASKPIAISDQARAYAKQLGLSDEEIATYGAQLG